MSRASKDIASMVESLEDEIGDLQTRLRDMESERDEAREEAAGLRTDLKDKTEEFDGASEDAERCDISASIAAALAEAVRDLLRLGIGRFEAGDIGTMYRCARDSAALLGAFLGDETKEGEKAP